MNVARMRRYVERAQQARPAPVWRVTIYEPEQYVLAESYDVSVRTAL